MTMCWEPEMRRLAPQLPPMLAPILARWIAFPCWLKCDGWIGASEYRKKVRKLRGLPNIGCLFLDWKPGVASSVAMDATVKCSPNYEIYGWWVGGRFKSADDWLWMNTYFLSLFWLSVVPMRCKAMHCDFIRRITGKLFFRLIGLRWWHAPIPPMGCQEVLFPNQRPCVWYLSRFQSRIIGWVINTLKRRRMVSTNQNGVWNFDSYGALVIASELQLEGSRTFEKVLRIPFILLEKTRQHKTRIGGQNRCFWTTCPHHPWKMTQYNSQTVKTATEHNSVVSCGYVPYSKKNENEIIIIGKLMVYRSIES